ncbi:hypothetical protein [Levilactobacillus bambusae]|uniref:Uncharacterized protein n=1 Tax=Levilactobacillus bambusae TaxID=2024736 RepID=A0A2V1N160_9LACO|nr:hypothetical protein [Levilactobacillus bambusae]PWG00977.1 hypothetical protein DCM90_02035 [Levilactobacillus bambusae]
MSEPAYDSKSRIILANHSELQEAISELDDLLEQDTEIPQVTYDRLSDIKSRLVDWKPEFKEVLPWQTTV